jgi:flagellin
MIINHNIAALNTIRQLSVNATNTQKALEKLSSGLRINSAADDAAGLAISEKMRGQIRGLDMAQKNAQDGISLIQTAEGALNETHAILQRMRELAVQSSNGTATDDDRKAMQDEINQLTDEIDRIGNTTQFNTMNLLDGSQGKRVDFTDAASTNKITDVDVLGNFRNGTYQVTVANPLGSAKIENASGTNNNLSGEDVKYDTSSSTAKVGETYTISWDDGDSNSVTFTLKDASGAVIATTTGNNSSGALSSLNFNTGAYIFAFDGSKIGDGSGSVTFTTEMKADYTITGPAGETIETAGGKISNDGKVDVGGFSFTIDKNLTSGGPSNLVVSGNDIEFQIGANENQTTSLALNDMRASALGVENLKIDTQTAAQSAITTIDNAIKSVSLERGKLGAIQNRLEHTINNLGTSSQNLTAAESRIRDVDYALAA